MIYLYINTDDLTPKYSYSEPTLEDRAAVEKDLLMIFRFDNNTVYEYIPVTDEWVPVPNL